MKHIPPYLFSSAAKHWSIVKNKIVLAERLAIFLDYDGTLTPIKKHPALAILAFDMRNIIYKLSRLSKLKVAIVTGRSLSEIRQLVPLKDIIFAANHGYHITQKGKEWIHPDAERFLGIIHSLCAELRKKLSQFQNIYIENKKFTISIHYRNVLAQQTSQVKKIALNTIKNRYPSLYIVTGKKVIEVRPSTSWGKGCALQKIIQSFPKAHKFFPIFIGDDTTDEDGFRIVRPQGITIRVGRKKKTNAEYRVKNVKEVERILKSIYEIRENADSKSVKKN